MSTTTYYRYLNKVVYPFVYDSWLQNQAETIQELSVGKFVFIFHVKKT